MRIKILGNGGAINDGLPYNAFIIDKKLLVETPPDVMLSLSREKIDISSIEEIYISHLHGDHCFGFPFLALRYYYDEAKTKKNKKLKLFAPANSRDRLIELTEKALSVGNPCVDWVKSNVNFMDISKQTEIMLLKYSARLFLMDHFLENYGFVLKDGEESLFSYISDTKWSDNIELVLKENSKIILLDLNGEPDDPVPVHLSEKDILEKGIKIVNPRTIFYGTHLKYQKKSRHRMIKYVKPGMEIEIT